MFENLLKLVQENAGEAIIRNPAIPDAQNNAAVKLAGNGIADHLKGLATNGGIEKVIAMFNGGDGKQAEISAIGSNVAGSLMKQFGISNEAAGNIVQNLIPKVMDQFVSKTNDPDDKSFDLQDIIGSISGGTSGAGGMMDVFKKLF